MLLTEPPGGWRRLLEETGTGAVSPPAPSYVASLHIEDSEPKHNRLVQAGKRNCRVVNGFCVCLQRGKISVTIVRQELRLTASVAL